MIKSTLSAALVVLFFVSCTVKPPKTDEVPTVTDLDKALSALSLKALDQAALVFRVAYDKSLESWQGAGEQTVAGCRISGELAEKGLAEIRPWLDRRAAEEAERLLEAPKLYKWDTSSDTCDQNCSCGLGLRILEAAKLDSRSHAKMKDLKKYRARLEAKSELISAERAEFCTESITWICGSDLLKALR